MLCSHIMYPTVKPTEDVALVILTWKFSDTASTVNVVMQSEYICFNFYKRLSQEFARL